MDLLRRAWNSPWIGLVGLVLNLGGGSLVTAAGVYSVGWLRFLGLVMGALCYFVAGVALMSMLYMLRRRQADGLIVTFHIPTKDEGE